VVADFIGETNFLKGKFRSRNGETGVVETELGVFEGVVADPDWKPGEGSEAVLSIRPESWIFSEESAPLNAVHGEIHDSTYLGELAQYNFRAGAHALKIVEMNPHLSGRENGHKFFAMASSDDVVILKP
jgi:iron(III) transport system ATP-binding protein